MIKGLTTIGTKGKVKGKLFYARKAKHGYVLASRELQKKTGLEFNRKGNQVYVDSLNEVYELLKGEDYEIRMSNDETGQSNLRKFADITVIR